MSYNDRRESAVDSHRVKGAYISQENQVDGQNRQLFYDRVVDDLVWQIHVELQESIRRLGTDGVTPDLQVFLDAPDIVLVAVSRLLDDRLRVSPERFDEPLLRLRARRPDCQLPEPISDHAVSIHLTGYGERAPTAARPRHRSIRPLAWGCGGFGGRP